MAPTSRALELLSLLQARRDWPGELLAERLEVSVRTVRRDVERLRELGYRVEATKGPDGGYRLDAGNELPPLLFDDDQVIALAIALESAPMSGVDIVDATDRALATIRRVMPSRLRHRLGAASGAVVERAGSTDSLDPDVLVAVNAAVRAREVVRFDYASSDPATTGTKGARAPRRVEPHHLVARRTRWYLVAWDLDREDWRTFRLDRMRLRIPNGPRFTPRQVPGGDVRVFVAARFKGSAGADAWPCVGEAVVALPARDVVPFVHDGTVEALDDERCRVTGGSWSWIGLAAQLGRFDADLTEVSPPALAEAFTTLADRCRSAGQPTMMRSSGRV